MTKLVLLCCIFKLVHGFLQVDYAVLPVLGNNNRLITQQQVMNYFHFKSAFKQ